MGRLLVLACFLLLTDCSLSGKETEKKAAEGPPAAAAVKTEDGKTRDLLDDSMAAGEEAKKAEQEFRSELVGGGD